MTGRNVTAPRIALPFAGQTDGPVRSDIKVEKED